VGNIFQNTKKKGFPLLLGFSCCHDKELWVGYVFDAAIFENSIV
jgi:hypothetical protein